MSAKTTLRSAAFLGVLILAVDALAQVPQHPPGSICFTPQFWCWANPPGKPGMSCVCPTPLGPVHGVLG